MDVSFPVKPLHGFFSEDRPNARRIDAHFRNLHAVRRPTGPRPDHKMIRRRRESQKGHFISW